MPALSLSLPRIPGHWPVAASLLCALLTVAPAGHAARPATYPKAIKDAMDKGVKVVRKFPAASGLTGWVLNRDGTYSMAFTTGDGKTLIVGTLMNDKGDNLTDQYAEKYFPKPDWAALYKRLEKSSHVVEGTAAAPRSILYVFFDADCQDCFSLWKALQPYGRAGLQVRWIPVATLGPASMQKATAILGAADSAQALRKALENREKNRGAETPAGEAEQAALVNRIKANNALIEKFGLAGTPALVWMDQAGKARTKVGMPAAAELPAITGLPQQ